MDAEVNHLMLNVSSHSSKSSNLSIKLPQAGLNDVQHGLRRSKRFSAKPRVSSGTSQVLLVCDEIGLSVAGSLNRRLPCNYAVSSFVRSNGSFSYVTTDLECLTKDFTMSDHVIILMSTRHVLENTSKYLKTGIRRPW